MPGEKDTGGTNGTPTSLWVRIASDKAFFLTRKKKKKKKKKKKNCWFSYAQDKL